MAKKEKEKPAMLNFDGKEYEIDKMTDSQKELAAKTIRYNDHVQDVHAGAINGVRKGVC